MIDIQIYCVECQEYLLSYTNITRFGSSAGGMSKEEIVEAISGKTHNYFIIVGGKRSELGLWLQGGGTHLRTHAHGMWNDDLFKLPTCATHTKARTG